MSNHPFSYSSPLGVPTSSIYWFTEPFMEGFFPSQVFINNYLTFLLCHQVHRVTGKFMKVKYFSVFSKMYTDLLKEGRSL